MTKRVLALLLALPASVAACGGDDTPPPPACDVDETYNPPIVASNFVTGVNNPFFPLVPGTTWRYMEGANTVDVTVTTPDDATKEITLVGMGTGEAAHFMAPMDEAVVAHVREQGSYTVTIHARIFGKQLVGQASVGGLTTGGQGM